MANKNVIKAPHYITAGDASADVVGKWLDITGLDNIAFQAKWTGTPTGTILVEVSEDAGVITQTAGVPTNQPDGRLGASALTLPASMLVTAAVPGGGAGNFYFDFGANYGPIAAPWIRFTYKSTSGAGAISVGASGKSI